MPERTPGSRLRAARETAGLSRSQLASRSGVSLRTIARVELENRMPRVEYLQALTRALDVTVADILGETNEDAA